MTEQGTDLLGSSENKEIAVGTQKPNIENIMRNIQYVSTCVEINNEECPQFVIS